MKVINIFFIFLCSLFGFRLSAQIEKMDCSSTVFCINYISRADLVAKKDINTAKKIGTNFSYLSITYLTNKGVYDTIFNSLCATLSDPAHSKCFSYNYDSISQELNILFEQNEFIDSVENYWLPQIKNKTVEHKMQRLGEEILSIGDKKYHVWRFADKYKQDSLSAYTELYISKKDNIILQSLYYNGDGTINDNLSLVFAEKFHFFRQCSSDIYLTSDTTNIEARYNAQIVDTTLSRQLENILYGSFREVTNRGQNMQSFSLSFWLSNYYNTFLRKKNGIYKKVRNEKNKEKLVLYYSFSKKPIVRDYMLTTQCGQLSAEYPKIFNEYESLLARNSPYHNALMVRYVGTEAVDIGGKIRECYYFQETPKLELPIFATINCYSKVDIWIDIETLLPYKRIVWVAAQSEKNKDLSWRVFRKEEFNQFSRIDFNLKVEQE